MPIKLQKWITRRDLRANPHTLYVFGDNLLRKGYGGQAAAMRGEPNAVGIPTKASPSVYASDAMALGFLGRWFEEFENLEYFLKVGGGTVVWPEDGIGTGLADMKTHAPVLWETLELLRRNLFKEHLCESSEI